MLGPQTPRKSKKQVYVKLVAVLAALVIAGLVALDYRCTRVFAGLPYRDHIRAYLKTVVWRGMFVNPVKNIIFTRPENLSTTRLPVWEIQLSGKKLAALNNDLPLSGRTYQSGTLLIDGKPYPARFRFRGDGFWHWRSKQKSWKIQLRQGARYEGKKEFNLVNPRCTTTLVWPLTSHVARAMGLETPVLQHVHARLNGQYLGVLYLVENFDHDFTARHGLPEGALYEDEALGGPPFQDSWKRIDDWKIRPPEAKQEHVAGTNPGETYERHLTDFLQCVSIQDDREFYRRLEELVDIDEYLRWWAHASLFLDSHQDRMHNNRLYRNPTSAKLQQIPWDMTINYGREPDDGIDLATNPVTERLLQSPWHVHRRNEIIWKTLQGPAGGNRLLQWFDDAVDLIRPDIYSDPHKDSFHMLFPIFMILSEKYVISMANLPVTNDIFENDVRTIRAFLAERMSYLTRVLSATEATLTLSGPPAKDTLLPPSFAPVGVIGIEVGGEAGLQTEAVRVHVAAPDKDGSELAVFYGDAAAPVRTRGVRERRSDSEGAAVYAFPVHELLLPGRQARPPFGSAPVRFSFMLARQSSGVNPPAVRKVELQGVHPFTRQPVVLECSGFSSAADASSISRGAFLPPAHPPREIGWSGVKRIAEDVRVGMDELLIIRPGTRLEFSPVASLLSYGRITAHATEEAPILFTHAPGAAPWGVVALQGTAADGSVFDHCIFEYGGEDEIDGVFYSGSLSIYNADAQVKNCVFRFSQGDDGLNTKFSVTDVTRSRFMNNKADAYDLDFSSGLIAWNSFDNNGNDAIDCGTSDPTVSNNRIRSSGDKGISIGERSRPVVENNLIAGCATGIAVKDQSQPVIRENELASNAVGVSAYQKKKVFGGAQATVIRCRFHGNKKISQADAVSSVALVDCAIEEGGQGG
jgi:parallel beta-helix repeat protein